jgi:hypothetical protein
MPSGSTGSSDQEMAAYQPSCAEIRQGLDFFCHNFASCLSYSMTPQIRRAGSPVCRQDFLGDAGIDAYD